MKIELSIKADYFPEWGAFEGIRELVSNARDASQESHSPLDVRLRGKTLVITNENVSLPHEALLLGHTTKRGKDGMIGRFGEGLKGGVLALIRAGHPVKIRSGSEVWTPSIQRSDKFRADVLTFEIEKGRAVKDRVSVEIGGVDENTWTEMKGCFLFLLKPGELEKSCVNTSYGDLLVGESYAGKLFVKGIFVQYDVNMKYGYNFLDADVDRDRKMIASWNRNYKCRSIWAEAANKRPDMLDDFCQMLDQQAQDLEGVDDYSAPYLPTAVKDAVVKDFKARHGQDAVPVASLSESKDIEHLGKRGVVVSKPLASVLATVLGNSQSIKEEMKKEVLRRYSWHELLPVEQVSLTEAVNMINAVEPVSLEYIDVVDFRSENLMGQYKEDRIYIAKKYLLDPDETLRILIHEKAHDGGGDGDKGHVWRLEMIWKGVVTNMRRLVVV